MDSKREREMLEIKSTAMDVRELTCGGAGAITSLDGNDVIVFAREA